MNKNNIEAPLFYSFARGYQGRRLKYSGIYFMLRRLAHDCGISKPIRPHLLRHSRLDYLAKVDDFNERDLRIFAGWSKTSDMPNVYLHYGEKELDNKILAKQGIIKNSEIDKAQQTKVLSPKYCTRCNKSNPADALYCNCGTIIDSKEALRIDTVKKDADKFTEELMTTPIKKDVSLEQGMKEALFQTMLADKKLMRKFKSILGKIK